MWLFSNFKNALDSLDRGSLLDLLHRRGIPAGILSMISALCTNTESAVKIGGEMSHFFSVKSGLRQGYVLPTTLFNAFIDWVTGETVEKTD